MQIRLHLVIYAYRCARLTSTFIVSARLQLLSSLQPLLDTLNLCKNRVSRIPLGAVQHLSRLKSLLLGSNELSHIDDVAALGCLPSLEVLDLQSNRLKADDLQPLLQLLARLPRLAVLYLHGNPLASSSPHYRQRVLSALRGLTFLDERPVFPNERRGCDAWGAEWARTGGDAAAAGAEEERARAACAREAHTEEVARHESFRLMVQQAQEEAAAKRALAAGGCNGRAETAASTAAPEQIALSGGLEASGNGDDGADDDDDRCSTASETQLRNRGNGPHSTASSADPDGMPGLEPWERTAQAFGLLDPESDIDPKLIIN